MKNLFFSALGGFGRVGGAPQLKATIDAVDVGKALPYQVGSRALARIAVVADDQCRCVQVGIANEVGDRMVVQVAGTGDVTCCVSLRVTNVDHDGTLRTQGQGLFGGMRLNSLMGLALFRVDR